MQTLIFTLNCLSALGILATGVLGSGAYQFYCEKSPAFPNSLLVTLVVFIISLSLFFLAVLLKSSTY